MLKQSFLLFFVHAPFLSDVLGFVWIGPTVITAILFISAPQTVQMRRQAIATLPKIFHWVRSIVGGKIRNNFVILVSWRNVRIILFALLPFFGRFVPPNVWWLLLRLVWWRIWLYEPTNFLLKLCLFSINRSHTAILYFFA